MIFACLLILLVPTTLLPNNTSSPTFLLPSASAHKPHHLARMSDLSLEIMKQLLADQARVLLSELKNHVKVEVAIQMEAHSTMAAKMNDDQTLLRKQLDDLSTQLKTLLPPIPPRWSDSSYNPTTPPTMSFTPADTSHASELCDLNVIESSK